MPSEPRALSGETKIFAILGNPIAQVKSPQLFNAAFASRGIDAVMIPINVGDNALELAISLFRSSPNFHGLVITVPHKVTAATHVESLGPRASRIGAVNAIRKRNDGCLMGEIFDGVGFTAGFAAANISLSGKRILVLGAGGAGRAVVDAIADYGPSEICIFDKVVSKAKDIREIIASRVKNTSVVIGSPSGADFDVVINCTPVGMNEADPLPIDINTVSTSALVADIIMKPAITALLREAALKGCRIHPGLPMLEAQIELLIDFFEGLPKQ